MENNEKSSAPKSAARFNRLLLIGAFLAIAFLVAGQLVTGYVLSATPFNGEALLNVGLGLNIMVVPSVALLAYGAIMSYRSR